MGNPIQYHNTDNKGGFRKTASVRPPGRTQRGVNENVSPVRILLECILVNDNKFILVGHRVSIRKNKILIQTKLPFVSNRIIVTNDDVALHG